jgi:signal transduction histidine kinase
LTVVAYVEAAIAAGGLALFRDPFFDPHCWDDCTRNVLVVDRVDWLADALHREHVWFAAIAALGAAVVALRRLVRATRVARRVTWGVAAGAAVLAVATVIYAVALTRTPLEDPGRRSFSAAFMLTCAAVDLIAISLVGGAARAHARRRSIARITAELGAASQLGSLDAALGTAIDDPTVSIAYWLPGPQRYIDHQGRPVDEPRATPDRQVTPLLRGGRRIALVDHHLIGDVDIARAIGPAMLLAFENERLRAEILARVHELERSRARIVQAGDAERSRLERDLHDGAQAFLVAVINDVGVAYASATREGDLRTAALVAEAAAAARSAFSELRELAAGIHPTVLAEAGLEPALATLGDTASIPVELRAMPGCRFAADVEMAAYVVAADALRDASRRGATYVTIDIAADRNGMLIVEVVDDGPERRDALVRAADRLGAVGGRVVDRPSGLRAEIPCG